MKTKKSHKNREAKVLPLHSEPVHFVQNKAISAVVKSLQKGEVSPTRLDDEAFSTVIDYCRYELGWSLSRIGDLLQVSRTTISRRLREIDETARIELTKLGHYNRHHVLYETHRRVELTLSKLAEKGQWRDYIRTQFDYVELMMEIGFDEVEIPREKTIFDDLTYNQREAFLKFLDNIEKKGKKGSSNTSISDLPIC